MSEKKQREHQPVSTERVLEAKEKHQSVMAYIDAVLEEFSQ